MPKIIWTIGHSNHPLAEFLEMLASNSIKLLADVRRFPGSRRHPQFGHDQLVPALAAVDIAYHHFGGLGGRRTWRAPHSPNTAWRVEAFNAYADHLQTDEFRAAFAELQRMASVRATAIMCSEALPWHCHRRVVADALVAAGWTVLDIFTANKTTEHLLTNFAQVANGQVTYPGLFGAEEI
jgi:uncharacterized protein (DUF488 family)